MPVRSCSRCGSRQMVASQERAYRCRNCGARVEMDDAVGPSDAGARRRGGANPTGREPTILVDATDGAGASGERMTRAAIACPGCGMFTAERLCETCGQPIPRPAPLIPAARASGPLPDSPVPAGSAARPAPGPGA